MKDIAVGAQMKEAGKEAKRIFSEKRLWPLRGFFFYLRAFFDAAKCAGDDIKAIKAGNGGTVCDCGYHPSRRATRTMITMEGALLDLKNIAEKFGIVGARNETVRSADILLETIRAVRDQLAYPRFLELLYVDNAGSSEKLPSSVRDVVKYFCAKELSVRQADNALIEIKGRYETLFKEMRAKSSARAGTSAVVSAKLSLWRIIEKDLERLAEHFPTIGEGTLTDQAATVLLNALDTLVGQLNQLDLLKEIYVDSGKASEMLPESMCSIARRFCAGLIDLEQAEREIGELKEHYIAMFDEIGIKPSRTVMAIGL